MVLEIQPTGTTAAPGETLGRYRIVRRIASGGMATVYLGHAFAVGGFRRSVAVKVCHPHLREDPQFAAMFLDEATLAARIHHPNVVATLDVANEPAGLYLVMDYVDGVTLAELLRLQLERGRPLEPAHALRVVGDLLAGLEAAHTLRDDRGRPLRIVHRDVSPQNVLVGTDGVARLTDFGIARAEARVAQTRTGEIKGKVGYMAPEQLERGEASVQSDVYAAGVVLWEALTGRRLFAGSSDVGTMRAALAGVTERPGALAPGLPAALDAAVMRALDGDPARRFATAAAFGDALERVGLDASSPRLLGGFVRGLTDPSAAPPTEATARGVPDAVAATALTPGAVIAAPEVGPLRARAGALMAAAAMALVASLVFPATSIVRARDVRAPDAHALAPRPASRAAVSPVAALPAPALPAPVARPPSADPPAALVAASPPRTSPHATRPHRAHRASHRPLAPASPAVPPRFRPGAV